MFQKGLITLVNVQFSQKSLHFWDMDFMFVVWKCTDIYSGKSENHFCHNNPVTVQVLLLDLSFQIQFLLRLFNAILNYLEDAYK